MLFIDEKCLPDLQWKVKIYHQIFHNHNKTIIFVLQLEEFSIMF